MRYYQERVESSRNFANKIWNASRFIMMYDFDKVPEEIAISDLTEADRWILSKVNRLAQEVTDNMERYDLGIAVGKLTEFVWEEFCDWYIEMVKPRLYNEEDETRKAALLDFENGSCQFTEAASSVHAFHNGRNLQNPVGYRRIDYGVTVAGA